MLQLDGERNICLAEPMPIAPPADWTPRLRKVTRSPIEEMQARIQAHGKMVPIPDALAALMLQEQRRETVEANGIAFKIDGATYRYYSPDSQACLRVGEEVLFSFDRDNLDVIYVLSEDGRFLEAVPQDGKVEWFSQDMDKQIARYRRVTQHVHEGLKKTHAETTHREHDRAKANAEALQMTHHFPLPDADPEPEAPALTRGSFDRRSLASAGRAGTETSLPGRGRPFARAHEVQAAQDAVRRQKTDFLDRERKIRNVRVSPDDMAAATVGRRQEETEEEFNPSNEEITSILRSK